MQASVKVRLVCSCLGLALQRLGVTVAGVYGQLYGHCSEPLVHMASVDRAAWVRETVHIYGGTRDGARAVWTPTAEKSIASHGHYKILNKQQFYLGCAVMSCL
jgi:hypothetical protein